ncbi:MAG: AlkZ family DNA glycosylase [Nitrososphaerota archaeon]|nr:AlkZ family DNA glycosylase [Nitrososphaerota archaeon]MDG6941842.1 AlkZ family DNA glycosylase [Nitrososphaerota archaeon]
MNEDTSRPISTGEEVQRVTWKQVTAFRLARHHLTRRAPSSALTSVPGEICGAQAQLLLAGQVSIWARVRGVKLPDLGAALWKERSLARAWCMRRTMFILPSDELSTFVRGSALRAEREMRWVLGKGVPKRKLEELVGVVLNALDEPITQSALAVKVSKSMGYKVKYKTGGVGWGNRKKVPWVDFGDLVLPANYLLHLAGSRGVYCSGPSEGNESTFVRADRWVPHWKDISQAEAERELLRRYLTAFGPATFSDFAIWTGMTAGDARRIWSLGNEDMIPVDVEGWNAMVLRNDLPGLLKAHLNGPVVRLLPFFDSFLLGHRSHRNIVGPVEHRLVYRPQGWVSPVLLLDGRAAGVWSHVKRNSRLEVGIKPFSRLPARISSMARQEADELGGFLGCSDVRVKIS